MEQKEPKNEHTTEL